MHSGMSDLDKLRAPPFIIGTDAEAERLRKLWGRFIDGEIEEEDWEREWQPYLAAMKAVAAARKREALD
jgi:hypothetical protein